jgi:hypothetical protein
MNLFKSKSDTEKMQPDPETDPVLAQALLSFRQSVHAWSEAEYARPRQVSASAHGVWRLALSWALGCAVIVGAAGSGLYEHHRIEVDRQAAQARIEHQRQLAEQQKARETDESLLANVDTDVSRSVPAALEPLAQLMDSDSSQ